VTNPHLECQNQNTGNVLQRGKIYQYAKYCSNHSERDYVTVIELLDRLATVDNSIHHTWSLPPKPKHSWHDISLFSLPLRRNGWQDAAWCTTAAKAAGAHRPRFNWQLPLMGPGTLECRWTHCSVRYRLLPSLACCAMTDWLTNWLTDWQLLYWIAVCLMQIIVLVHPVLHDVW
jgi:hypothetical protein